MRTDRMEKGEGGSGGEQKGTSQQAAPPPSASKPARGDEECEVAGSDVRVQAWR